MREIRIKHCTQNITLCNKFVSYLPEVGVFFAVNAVSSTNKTDRHNITEILLKVALNTITQTPTLKYKQNIRLFYGMQKWKSYT